MREAFIFDALRTPRGKGKRTGALYEVKPIDLLSHCFKALAERNQLDTKVIDDVLIGCVTPIDDQGYNVAKAALIQAGWDDSVSGMQINRFCASGLEAVNLAAMKIRSTWEELVVAGGVECMSRIPIGSDGGPLMYDPELISKANFIPQGVSADLIATLEGFTREQVDHYALQSQKRATTAQAEGYFKNALLPIYDRNNLLILERDELVRPDTDGEVLSALTPAFADLGNMGFAEMALHRYPMLEKINHVHTAGNSCGIVDGAGVVLIGSREKGKSLNLKPRAKIRSIANVGVEPTIMLSGPAPAAKKALKASGMDTKDIDLWECNEAFSAVVLKFQRDLGIENEILNVNGGAIALGHPLGATGAMLLGTLLDELERRDLNTGLVTLGVGGGMGVATIIERV